MVMELVRKERRGVKGERALTRKWGCPLLLWGSITYRFRLFGRQTDNARDFQILCIVECSFEAPECDVVFLPVEEMLWQVFKWDIPKPSDVFASSTKLRKRGVFD